jgi:predicted transposase YbfD/YdcC
MLARMYDRMQDLIHLKTMDQPMYELKVQDIKLDARSRVLAIEYRQNPTDDSRKELLDILTDQFEVRQKIREHELARLKEKISQLENQIEERANNRQKIINKQLQDVTQKPGKAKW